MKTLICALLASLVATPALAADATCSLPDPAVPRAIELCEILRADSFMRSADWNVNACASEVLRIGLLVLERREAQRAARRATATIVNDAVTAYEANHPTALIPARCGDGTLDSEFGEGCDDGNTDNGDGCDDSCQVE